MIKGYFLTGLALLLPVILTIWILLFLINLLTKPFVNFAVFLLEYFDHFDRPFLFLSREQVVLIVAKVFVLCALVGIILLVGYIGRLFLLKYLGSLGDYLLHRIPIINKFYKSVQDLVSTLFAPKTKERFSSVVLVPFPYKGMYSVGFVTQGELPLGSDSEKDDRLSIFVIGTPNPTMGFMLLFKRSEIITLNMKVDEALKFVISCGIVEPNFQSQEQS